MSSVVCCCSWEVGCISICLYRIGRQFFFLVLLSFLFFFLRFLQYNYNVSRYGFLKCILFRFTCDLSKFKHIFQIENISSVLKNIQLSSLGILSFRHIFSFASVTPKLSFFKFFYLFTSLYYFLGNFLGYILSLRKSLPLYSLLFNPSI